MVEGKKGDLQVFVIPYNYPMNCQIIKIPIKPLSLHFKIPGDVKENDYEFNTLKI